MKAIKKRKNLTEEEMMLLDNFIKNEAKSKKEVCRAQAILFLNDNYDNKTIERFTSLNAKYAYELTSRFKRMRIDGLKDKRKKQTKNILTKTQKDEILSILKNETPKKYEYDWEQWTTGILADLIEKKYNVRYKSKTSYYLIFKEARFSFRKPDRRYYKRDEDRVAQWKKETESLVLDALKKEDTVVLCGDEMVLSTRTTFQKVWLPIDGKPKIESSGQRKNRSIYGFLDIKTGREYAFKTEWQNMYQTVGVLKKLRQQIPDKKIILLWDNSRPHHGSEVAKFIQEDGNIQIIWFPPYSPEENPQEHVWKTGRSNISHNQLILDIDEITDKFVDYLNSTIFKYKMF